MPEYTIKVWELSQENGMTEISLPESSSLDAITRHLPQGYYTTFRTYGGGTRVLGLRAHLQRLYQSAALQRIIPSVPEEKLRRYLVEALQVSTDEARVRLILTFEGRVYLVQEPLKTLPAEVYSQGVKAVTTSLERENPRLKSTAFISASEGARTNIARSKIFEALLVHNGFILEGMTSNFFYIKEGKLGTARKGILLGVTRRSVLRVARDRGFDVVYQPLRLEQIPDIDEAFLTSSSRGIVPIVQIDETPVGEGIPGPITKRLMEAYSEYVLQAAEKI